MPSDLNVVVFYCYLTFLSLYLFNFLAAYASLSYMCISRFLATFAYFFALLANAADVDHFNLVK